MSPPLVLKYCYSVVLYKFATWQFGGGQYDSDFKDMNMFLVAGIDNANFRLYIQNQYGMFILNKVVY